MMNTIFFNFNNNIYIRSKENIKYIKEREKDQSREKHQKRRGNVAMKDFRNFSLIIRKLYIYTPRLSDSSSDSHFQSNNSINLHFSSFGLVRGFALSVK